MSVHLIAGRELDGGAIDVLHKLHFRGAQESGELPSKGGLSTLLSFGWAKTDWSNAKPHTLTGAGKIIAELYYEAKAERVNALLQSEITQGDLTAAVEAGDIRWMTRGKPDIREWVPADTVYTLDDIRHDIAFTTRVYQGRHPETRAYISLTFIVAPSGTDVRVNIVGEDV